MKLKILSFQAKNFVHLYLCRGVTEGVEITVSQSFFIHDPLQRITSRDLLLPSFQFV